MGLKNKKIELLVLINLILVGCGKTSLLSKRDSYGEPDKGPEVETKDTSSAEDLSLRIAIDTDLAQDGCFTILPTYGLDPNDLSKNKALTQEQDGRVTVKTVNKADLNQIFMLSRKGSGSFTIHTRTPFQALTASAEGNKRGTLVKSSPFSSSAAQRFIFTSVTSGSQTGYLITLRGSNQALEVNQKDSTLVQSDLHRRANQRFLLSKTDCK